MTDMNQYLYLVQTVRPEMLHSPTEDEKRISGEHIAYMRNRIKEGIGIFGGACLQRDSSHFGVFIYQAEDDEAAKAVVQNDPAVKNRIMRALWYPYMIALWNAEAAKLDDGMNHYFYKIQTVRPEMMEDPTEFEQRMVSEHFAFLKDLTEQGIFCVVGRTQTVDYSTFGLGVLRAKSLEEAQAITANDPVIVNRVMRRELFPFGIAMIKEG